MTRVLITDLDNTLYDWAGYFIPSFRAMLDELRSLSGVPEAELIASFKRVHQAHGTSEYAFAIEELDVLDGPPGDRLQKYHSALDAFREVKRATLAPYPGVLETLEKMRASGWTVFAHTDSMLPYASARVIDLGIAPLLDGIVATRDHGVPESIRREHEIRYRETAQL